MKKQLVLTFLIFSFFSVNILTDHSTDFYIQLEKDATEFNAQLQKKVFSIVNQYSTKLKSVSNINEFKNWITSFQHDLNIIHQEHDAFIDTHDNTYIPIIDFVEAIQEQIKDVVEEFDSIQQMSHEEFQKYLVEFKQQVLNAR